MNNDNNILVVDDSDITRQFLKDIFKGTGLNVITCSDGLEGIQKAIQYKPVLILLDILMPNFDGIKMLQVIKLLDGLENVPVIVISANTNRTNVMAATEAGADRIITKPILKEKLFESIKEFLGDLIFEKPGTELEITSQEEDSLRSKLKDYFVENFALKGKGLIKALENQEIDSLKTVVHEIRGTGGAIGYPELTEICGEIEDSLDTHFVNWWYVREKCDKIFQIVEEMKIEQEG